MLGNNENLVEKVNEQKALVKFQLKSKKVTGAVTLSSGSAWRTS